MDTQGFLEIGATKPPSLPSLLKSFQRLLADRRLQEAYDVALAGTERFPNESYVWVTKAICERMLDFPAEAMDSIGRSLETGETPEALFELIQIARGLGNQGEANLISARLHARFPEWLENAQEVLARAVETQRPNEPAKPSVRDGLSATPETSDNRVDLRIGLGDVRTRKAAALSVAVLAFADVEKDPEKRRRWGDYWFKKDLEDALVCQGVDTTGCGANVLIHLFGAPLQGISPDTYNILWIHSHPDWVTPDLLSKYDKIYCVSPAFTDHLRSWGFDASVLIGATSNKIPAREAEKIHDVVFVANAKANGRTIISDLLKTPYEASIWGIRWEGRVPKEWIRGTYYPNERLNELYARSKVVLNDHHLDMRMEGFISPRIFDAVASGATVISDRVERMPEDIAALCSMYDSPAHLADLIGRALASSDGGSRTRGNARFEEKYSFHAVASQIISDLPEDLLQSSRQSGTGVVLKSPSKRRTEPKTSEAYLVMGMHRSGTSLITHLLHRSGVYTGSTKDHLPPSTDNPTGFWELKTLVELNKIILYLANGSWASPPPEDDIESISVHPRIEQILKYFAGIPKWAIKDPRLCLTLPVIAPALPENAKVVMVRRSAESIAESLCKRNGIAPQAGKDLAKTYVSRMERYCRPYECFELAFESLFGEEKARVLGDLAQFIGTDKNLVTRFDAIVHPELKHH